MATRDSLSILALATPLATKRLTPTGGVMKPIARLQTMMIPKCTGSTPTLTTTGRRIGVRMTMAASASMKVPTISSRTLIINSTKILLSVTPRIASAMICGTCSMVMMLPKMVAMAINTITMAEVEQASMKHGTIFFRFSSR